MARPRKHARQTDRERDEDLGFGPENGRGRFSGRYTREQDEATGGRQFGRGTRTRFQRLGSLRDWYEPEPDRRSPR